MFKYRGKVIRSDSLDPNYKVEFSFCSENYEVTEAVALFTRMSPFPKVCFDDYTDYLMEKNDVDEETIKNIKLEIGKTVFDYIFSTLDTKRI
ncbi:MAG: hypothetical protein N3I35_07350 [Clostridia bacterium]|nr:hypothetical protein [Clostridia bacterium]